jgi:hypothetical protein
VRRGVSLGNQPCPLDLSRIVPPLKFHISVLATVICCATTSRGAATCAAIGSAYAQSRRIRCNIAVTVRQRILPTYLPSVLRKTAVLKRSLSRKRLRSGLFGSRWGFMITPGIRHPFCFRLAGRLNLSFSRSLAPDSVCPMFLLVKQIDGRALNIPTVSSHISCDGSCATAQLMSMFFSVGYTMRFHSQPAPRISA